MTLRNIVPSLTATACSDVKSLIKVQLSNDITVDDFALGYAQGNSVVNIRSKADLHEIWEGLKKGQSITLWCDNLPVEENSSHDIISHSS